MPADPISDIQGQVVGLGVATKLASDIPIVGPPIAHAAQAMFGSGKDYNDQSAPQLLGSEGGVPLFGGGGGAAAGGEAGLGDLAAVAAV